MILQISHLHPLINFFSSDERCHWFSKDDKILCTSWKGKKKERKPVLIVITNENVVNVTNKQKIKPSTIHNYNMNLNGCDKAGQMIEYCGPYNQEKQQMMETMLRLYRFVQMLMIIYCPFIFSILHLISHLIKGLYPLSSLLHSEKLYILFSLW